jgi:chromate transporter
VRPTNRPTLSYLFFTFLKIGSTSWGGFMALISVVQKKIVEQDKKIDNEMILEGISLASVLPGPVAFNVVTFIGYKLRGIKGALVSMAGIVLPSFLMMILLSYLYIRYGNIPSFSHFFSGILPAIAAIIVSVALSLAKKNITDRLQVVIAVISAVVIVYSKEYISTMALMVASGILGYFLYSNASITVKGKTSTKSNPLKFRFYWFLLPLIIVIYVALMLVLPSILPGSLKEIALLNRKLILTFSGMSISLFGGGYVVIPAMQQIIVNTMGWLTNKEFTDAVAMGQVTPGPIFVTATFIGYKVAGFWGAVNATIAIFLPPGLLMIACSRFLDFFRNSPAITAIFKGLRPAIIGMIAAAAFTILAHGEISGRTGLLFCVFLLLAIRYKTDPVYLIPGAGIIGLLIF